MSRQRTMTKVSVKKSGGKHGGKHKTREVRIRPTDNGGFIVQHEQDNAEPDSEPMKYTPPPPMQETGHEDRAGMLDRLDEIFPAKGSESGGSGPSSPAPSGGDDEEEEGE